MKLLEDFSWKQVIFGMKIVTVIWRPAISGMKYDMIIPTIPKYWLFPELLREISFFFYSKTVGIEIRLLTKS